MKKIAFWKSSLSKSFTANDIELVQGHSRALACTCYIMYIYIAIYCHIWHKNYAYKKTRLYRHCFRSININKIFFLYLAIFKAIGLKYIAYQSNTALIWICHDASDLCKYVYQTIITGNGEHSENQQTLL